MYSKPTEPAEVASAPISAVIGPYVRVSLLGEGGFGQVFRAWDRSIGRWVAIKIMKGAGAERRARFEREARVAATLEHPNIARIYAVGEHEGQLYLAMQFVEGTTLRRWRRSTREAARLMSDAARAVHVAHQRGIIHRDLKPDNLMVETNGTLFVMDFGLARDVEGVTLTASGLAVGTPGYMPPEQARGEIADARSDVYSLGATLYEMLTGRAAFEGSNVLDVLMAVVSDDPMAPRRLRPEIDETIEAIVLKCLEKEPGARYASAGALADDLDRYLRDEPTEARPATLRQKMSRGVRRRMVPMVVIAAIIALFVGGLVVFNRGSRGAATAREEQLRSLRATAKVCLAAALDLRRSGNEEGMEEHARRLEESCGPVADLPETKFLLGRLRRAQMRDEDALALQDGAIRGDPQLLAARYERVVLTARKLRARMEKVRSRAYQELATGSGRHIDAVFRLAAERIDRDDAVVALRKQIAGDLLELDRAEVPPGERACARGFSAWTKGEPGVALARFREAIDADPRLEEAHESIAPLLLQEGRHAESLKAWTAGLEQDRGYRPFLEGRIRTSLTYGEEGAPDLPRLYENAESDATELIRRRPEENLYRVLRAEVRSVWALHGREDRYDAAMADLDAVLKAEPDRADALRQRGALRSNRASRDLALTAACLALSEEAVRDLTRALVIEPDALDALQWRGVTRLNLARYQGEAGVESRRSLQEAAEDFGRLISLAPGHLRGWIHRGQARWRLALDEARRGASGVDSFREAVSDLETAARLAPADGESYGEMAVAFLAWAALLDSRGEDERTTLDAAEQACLKSVELSPRDPQAWTMMGQVRIRLAQSRRKREMDVVLAARQAVEDFDTAMRLGADDAVVWYSRAQARVLLEDFDAAELDFTQALRRAPSWVECLVRRGEMRWTWARTRTGARALALLRLACEDLEKAVLLAPSNADGWHELGLTHDAMVYEAESDEEARRHFRDAIAAFEKVGELRPSDAMNWTYLGGTFVNFGLYLWRQGELPHDAWDRAVGHFDRSLALDGKSAITWHFRGNVFINRAEYALREKEGDARAHFREARRSYEKAVECKPAMAPALQSQIERCKSGE